MTQLGLEALFTPPAVKRPRRAPKQRASIEERFRQFHDANPHVFDTLRRLALEAVGAGRTRLGMKALWERARWDLSIATEHDEFKLDNSMTAPYARMLMEQEPRLAGVFETRQRRAR